jgi:hypothetical protein
LLPAIAAVTAHITSVATNCQHVFFINRDELKFFCADKLIELIVSKKKNSNV